MPESTNKSVTFRIVAAKIDQFASFEENFKAGESIRIQSSVSFTYECRKRLLDCTVSALCSMESGPIVKGIMTVSYELSEESVNSLYEDGSLSIPADILAYFASNAYAALRGMLVGKLDSSSINFVLPISPISSMIKEPVSIKFPSNQAP